MKHMNHRWGDPDRSVHHTTKRVCVRCGLVRLTRKEPPAFWTQFVRDGENVNSERTPRCVAVEKAA